MPSVTEASLDIPTIDAIPTDTHDYVAPSPDLGLSDAGDVNDGNATPPLRGFRGRWLSRDRNLQDGNDGEEPSDEENSGTPRVDWDMESAPANPEQPSGVVVDEKDAKVLANHTFLSNVKWSSISMPWESGFMKNIFGEDVLGLSSDLRQDASWIEAVTHVPVSTIAADSSNPASSGPELKPAFVKCVKAIREQSFTEMREAEMKAAVTKWSLFLRSSLEHSVVGKQINASPGEMLDIVRAAMGVKSPSTSTVLSRANSMFAFMQWHTLGPSNDEMLPLREEAAWQYVSHLKESQASPSRATSFVQACRFCHYVLGVEGALQVVSSRRVCGLADIQLSGKREAKQARPLSVKEAQDLHRVASSSARHLVDRVVASHLLLMMYCRCRHSDTVAVEDVLHDHSEGAGYVQLRTKFHKGSKSAAKKSLLLPIVGSSAGVGTPSWVQSWWETRRMANLPVEGHLEAPLMPAPAPQSDTQWSTRPLTSTEITAMLRSLLGVFDDPKLTSHSLKTTCLSWCAKADVSRERGRDLLASWLKNPRVVGVFLAPPCGTASRARSIKLKRKRNAPEPLRDDNNPNGLKSLSFVNKMKISQANKLYHLTSQVLTYAVKHGMVVCVENPQFSLFWATTFLVSVAKLLRYTIFHSCQYGSNRQKKTMLAHNHKAFNQL